MPTPRSRDLAYLRAYLHEHARHPLSYRSIQWGFVGPFVLITAIAVGIWSVRFIPGWAAILAGFFLVGGFFDWFNRRLLQPGTPQEERQVRVYEMAQHFSRSLERNQIHPLAARLLEGCAFHRSRVLAAAEKTGWGHAALREQAVAAADEAMEEAMAICAGFAGPGHSRGAAWKDLAQDVVEGQLGDAVKRLQTMLEAERPGEIVDRRKLPPDLWPAYDIAVKLQRLASEIETASRQTAAEEPAPVSALDQVLADFAAVREAERELDEEQHLRQH